MRLTRRSQRDDPVPLGSSHRTGHGAAATRPLTQLQKRTPCRARKGSSRPTEAACPAQSWRKLAGRPPRRARPRLPPAARSTAAISATPDGGTRATPASRRRQAPRATWAATDRRRSSPDLGSATQQTARRVRRATHVAATRRPQSRTPRATARAGKHPNTCSTPTGGLHRDAHPPVTARTAPPPTLTPRTRPPTPSTPLTGCRNIPVLRTGADPMTIPPDLAGVKSRRKRGSVR
jgi:hypothetical protein